MLTSELDPVDLLAGPRGRRLCLELAQRADEDGEARGGAGASASLVLKNDAQRAREEMRRRYPHLRRTESRARLDGDAFMHGCAAAENSDLGQTRMGARRALGA